MVDKNTELIFIDEWSENTLDISPKFRSEQPSVDRQIAVFHATEIPDPKAEPPEWIENNTMECLV